MRHHHQSNRCVYTLIYVAAAAIFLALFAMDVSGLGRTLIKAVPVTTLAVLVLREMRGFARIGLAGALIGSVCGDVLLDLPGEGFFIFGLVAFLIGHLFYCALFFRFAKRPDGLGWLPIAVLVLFAAGMMWLFRNIEPNLYPPVVIYIAVIVAMSIGALLVPSADRLLFWGALLFILSDVILAVNRFLVPIPFGRLINISIYFVAQYVIIFASRSIWDSTDSDPAL
jgi:uncharacterized membrane protein YhhN